MKTVATTVLGLQPEPPHKNGAWERPDLPTAQEKPEFEIFFHPSFQIFKNVLATNSLLKNV